MCEEKNGKPQSQATNKKIRNDLVFVLALATVLLLAILGMLLFRVEGNTVSVTVNGKFFGEYSLLENRVVEINTEYGYNRLVIEDGKAYVDMASCPDGICAKHRPILYQGESIICLPNEVVIHIKNQRESGGPDIIV